VNTTSSTTSGLSAVESGMKTGDLEELNVNDYPKGALGKRLLT
jgi:hypothetical protein